MKEINKIRKIESLIKTELKTCNETKFFRTLLNFHSSVLDIIFTTATNKRSNEAVASIGKPKK